MSPSKREQVVDHETKQLEQLERDFGQVLRHAVEAWGGHFMWKEICKASVTSPWITDPPQLFNWITRSHLSMIALYVRRVMDKDSRAVSLRNCLCRIACGDVRITRERFIARYLSGFQGPSSEVVQFAVRAFDQIAGTGAEEVPPTFAAADLASVRERCGTVVAWVDKRLAHFDRTPPDAIPGQDEIEATLRFVTEVAKKWNGYLTCVCVGADTPVMGNLWDKPLRTPWFTSDRNEALCSPVVPRRKGPPKHQRAFGAVPWIEDDRHHPSDLSGQPKHETR